MIYLMTVMLAKSKKNILIFVSLNSEIMNSLYYNSKYIEYLIEIMSFSSSSISNFNEQSNPNQRKCTNEKRKRKKIRKDKKKQNQTQVAHQSTNFVNIEEFLQTNGSRYFSSSLQNLRNQFLNAYRSLVHVKEVLSQQENVYHIKNYKQIEQIANQYLSLIKETQNIQQQRVGFKKNHHIAYLTVGSSKSIVRGMRRSKIICFSKSENILIKKRKLVLRETQEFLRKFSLIKENQNINYIQKQILTLCKLNKSQQNCIINNFNNLLLSKKEDPLNDIKINANKTSASDQYIKILIMKNLKKGLDESPVDLLNYFKIAQFNEKSIFNDVTLKRLSNQNQLKDYLKSKRHRLGKSSQHSLKTCCSGCFSSYYQIYNPIQTCSDCGMRMHKYCQTIKNKCQRCKYLRKTTQQKSLTAYCYICQRSNEKGLSIQQINKEGKQESVHTFCLLTQQKWTIQNETIVLKNVDETKMDQQAGCCQFCNKQSKFTVKCKKCPKESHLMCAFLNGCSINYSDQPIITIDCCSNMQKDKLAFSRKYKLNYEKILYKKSIQFSNFLQ